MPFLSHRHALPVLIALLLTGCAGRSTSTVTQQPYDGSQPATEVSSPGTDLRLCEQELSALQKTAPEKHRELEAEFSRIMRAASNYSGVRNAVRADTQQSADAFYEYKTSVVCSQVHQGILESLTTLFGA